MLERGNHSVYGELLPEVAEDVIAWFDRRLRD